MKITRLVCMAAITVVMVLEAEQKARSGIPFNPRVSSETVVCRDRPEISGNRESGHTAGG